MSALLPPPASSSPELVLETGSPWYPRGLADLDDDAPARLHGRGVASVLERPCVAIVGTRRATAYGLRVTGELGRAFARAGACVVSGLASGIDGAAHRAALEEDGATIAVLGTGLDQVFPKAHRALQRTIGERGLLLTELSAAEHGMKHTFLRRNRIIAAMCPVVIVVEAPERSGALDTADRALNLDRKVAAVPGPIDQPQSVGANRLLRDGATPVTCIEDALALAGLTPPPRVPRGAPEGDAARVWKALGRGGLDMDTLSAAAGLPAARCMAAVTALEIQGSVECAMTGVIRRR